MHRTRQLILALLAIAGAITLVFGCSISFAFMDWDDPFNITLNPHLNPVTLESVAQFWRAPYGRLYVPVSYTMFALQTWISSLYSLDVAGVVQDPRVFHAVNVLLHIGVSLVVFGLLKMVVRHAWAACIGTLLFALHPLQVETVCWVTEQRGLLSHFFGLAAVLGLLKVEAGNSKTRGGRRDILCYPVATGLFVLALLSKPSAAMIPLVVLVWAWLLELPLKKHLALMAPWVALSVMCLLLSKSQQPDTLLNFEPALWQRPFVAGDALAFYLWKLAWPFGLAADYGRTPEVVLGQWWGYATWLVPTFILVLLPVAAAARVRHSPGYGGHVRPRLRRPLAASALFLIPLLPLLGLIPFGYQNWSTVADRYAYLALLSPALLVAVWAGNIKVGRAVPGESGPAPRLAGDCSPYLGASRRCMAGELVILVSVCALLSFRQSAHWRDGDALFARALAVNLSSGLAHNHIAAKAGDAGDYIKALKHLSVANRANPASAEVWNNLGMVKANQARYDEARDCFMKALQLRSDLASAHNNLGAAEQKLGNLDAAVEAYRHALLLNPRQLRSWINLGLVFANSGRREKAVAPLERAVALDPHDYSAQRELAVVYDQLKRDDDALRHYYRAMELQVSVEMHMRVGVLHAERDELEQSAVQFRRVLQLRPDDLSARSALQQVEAAMREEG